MYSITLQTTDSSIVSGDRLGQLQYAASNESDGSAAIDIAGSVFCQAEGSFTSSSNPTSLILATAAADASAAVGRIKVSDNGHILPMSDNAYDLGNNDLGFRNQYLTEGIVLESNTPSSTTNKLYNEGGTLKFNGSAIGGGTGGSVNGGGTTNYIPLWSASDTLGDSVIYSDAGKIGINQTSPTSQLHIKSTNRNNVVLIAEANDGNQTADLFRCIDASDNTVIAVEDDGQFKVGPSATSINMNGANGAVSQIYTNNNNLYVGANANTRIEIDGANDLMTFRASSTNDPMRLNSNGASFPGTSTAFNPLGVIHAKGGSDQIVSIFQANASQTEKLTEWRDSSANVLAYVNEEGSIATSGTVSGVYGTFTYNETATPDRVDIVRSTIRFGNTMTWFPTAGNVNQYLFQGTSTTRFMRLRIQNTDVRIEGGTNAQTMIIKTANTNGQIKLEVGTGGNNQSALTLYGNDTRIGEFWGGSGVIQSSGAEVKNVEFEDYVPPTTTNKLYNDNGSISFDGAALVPTDPVTGASGVANVMVINSGDYASITPDANTLYFIVDP